MADVFAGVLILFLVVVMAVGYLVVRVRQPEPPPDEPGGGFRPEGALADTDPVPRDADGTPMVEPVDDPQGPRR
jgi:hypothetical protein